jgi:hypothetical protein
LIARYQSQQPVDLETQKVAGFALSVLPIIKELREAGFTTLQSLTDQLNKRGHRTIKGQFWTPRLVGAILEQSQAGCEFLQWSADAHKAPKARS